LRALGADVKEDPKPYRGTSLIRNSPLLQDHHMTLGVVLL